jgi:hypothetical protein
MNFDIQLSENHIYKAGDIYTNSQGVNFLISFLYPLELIKSEGESGLTTIYRACCTLTGSTDCNVKLSFDQTSNDFVAVSLVNNQLVLTSESNRSNYCGILFPATRDNNGAVTSLTGTLHRAYLLPLK